MKYRHFFTDGRSWNHIVLSYTYPKWTQGIRSGVGGVEVVEDEDDN